MGRVVGGLEGMRVARVKDNVGRGRWWRSADWHERPNIFRNRTAMQHAWIRDWYADRCDDVCSAHLLTTDTYTGPGYIIGAAYMAQ